jgi:aspartate kinase
MKVFKFGGASVKDAGGVRNLAEIVKREKENLIIVVSAFGKTTNALEKVLGSWYSGKEDHKEYLGEILNYHRSVHNELSGTNNSSIQSIEDSFAELKKYLEKKKRESYDYEYDQVVSYGEIWSTLIVEHYLRKTGFKSQWTDIRKVLVTDDRYRDANINWELSSEKVKATFDFRKPGVYVTQGFIACTAKGKITTLGREGSDYTAAILANILDAESVVVWKDVSGLLNADPRWMPDATKLDEVSYREAVEMTFSGAKVIHPKTIKPLHNKEIPLYVKSFIHPDEPGTKVTADPEIKRVIPVITRKEKQILISLIPRDLSFVMGDNLSNLFKNFLNHNIKVNLVEASAVSIDVCVDDEREKVESLLNSLSKEYTALYNDGVELMAIRHSTPESVAMITGGRQIMLEQRTRTTIRLVVK